MKADSESVVNDEGEKAYTLKCDYQLTHQGKPSGVWIHFMKQHQYYKNWAEAYLDIKNKIKEILDKECAEKCKK